MVTLWPGLRTICFTQEPQAAQQTPESLKGSWKGIQEHRVQPVTNLVTHPEHRVPPFFQEWGLQTSLGSPDHSFHEEIPPSVKPESLHISCHECKVFQLRNKILATMPVFLSF